MSLQVAKIDPILGREIDKILTEKGVNTPILNNIITSKEQKDIIRSSFASIMKALNLDISDDSLVDTPNRIAKMYVDELFWGLNPDNFPKCTVIDNKMKYDEMVIEKNITSLSMCEHHFITIDAVAHVAYIPKNKILGLSKMNRIVEYFSRRPQVQERLVEQIYHSLAYILETPDVAVVIEGVHYCVKSRGVEDNSSRTSTAKLGGAFRFEHETRAEFMNIINQGKLC